jgi:hypothetical protein
MLVKNLISKVADDVGDPFFILARRDAYVAELNELTKALWRDAGASVVFREYVLPEDQSHFDLTDSDIIRFMNVAVSNDSEETARTTAAIKDFAGDVLYYVNEKSYRQNVEQSNGVHPNRGDLDYSVNMTFWLNQETGKYRLTFPSTFGSGHKLLVQALVMGTEYDWDDDTDHEIWEPIVPALTQGCVYRMARKINLYRKNSETRLVMQDAFKEWSRERRETLGLLERLKEEASTMLVNPHFWLGGMDDSDSYGSEYYGSNIGT